jgi:hypothetical protein
MYEGKKLPGASTQLTPGEKKQNLIQLYLPGSLDVSSLECIHYARRQPQP